MPPVQVVSLVPIAILQKENHKTARSARDITFPISALQRRDTRDREDPEALK